MRFIPISALNGDNVVDRSENMDWYEGPTLLALLETIPITDDYNRRDGRFPVQYVLRPQSLEHHDYRGYAGRIGGGVFRKGDTVTVLPSGLSSTLRSIDTFEGPVDEAFAPMSVTLTLEDDIDISRGDMIVSGDSVPRVSQDVEMVVCWLNEKRLTPGAKFALKHTTKEVRCVVKDIAHKIDITSLEPVEAGKDVRMNDIARITIRTTKPLLFDSYRTNRATGSMILIDEATNETVGAGMIL